MPEPLYSWSWLVLNSLHINFQSYLKPYRFRWWLPMSSSLEILGYDIHSLPDVIKDFRHIKVYCEDISPIVIANHRDELIIFINTKSFVLGSLLVSFSNFYFSENMLCIKFLFSSIQCTSFIPSIMKYSVTYAWQHQPFSIQFLARRKSMPYSC
jgi:hypothetical protein